MSEENIKAFFKKVESDKDLQTRMKKVSDENEKAATATLVKLAASEGFEFTASELAKMRAAKVGPFKGFGGKSSRSNCCYYASSCMPSCSPWG
jgi:predicted ribosomally synthesized peptide with nif11-like leader